MTPAPAPGTAQCQHPGCHARCRAPYDRCARHRPPPPKRTHTRSDAEKERRNSRKQEQRRKARGLSANMEGAW